MSRHGTTRTKIRSRRAGTGRKAARLIYFLRRGGLMLGGGVLFLWLCAWLWVGGFVQSGAQRVQQGFFDFTASQGFAVRRILLEGRDNTDPTLLRALLNVEPGGPILAFDPAEARDLVRRLSWVEDARIERRLPDTIYIHLTERSPMALWQNKGKIRLIDAQGVVLDEDSLAKFAGLPIIVGEDAPENAPELLRLLAAEKALDSRLEAATRIGGRRWDLKLRGGAEVKLPEQGIALALRLLASEQEKNGLLDREISSIDLRDPSRMTVRMKQGASAAPDYKVSYTIEKNI